jgi:hypothetical protein
MPRGHSQLQTEVDALKLQVAELQTRITAETPAGLADRIAIIESRINKMNETFATGYMPQNVGIE